jgi:cytosine/adenosine deaminase-related metal-dependent hydrolase
MGATLIEADWVVPISSPPFARGAVLVREGRIEAVGPAAKLRAQCGFDSLQGGGEHVCSFPGCVLLPGLVNAHSHLDYSAFQGFSRACGFGEWMLRLLRSRRKLTSEDYAASARWGAEECARNGITCIADTSFEGSTVARAAGEAGLRARVYLEVIGLDEAELPVVMERTEERLSVLGQYRNALVDLGLSPHAPYTVSWRLYREIARYADREGLHLATHVAESAAEVDFLERGAGSIARAYKAAGVWKGERWAAPGLRPGAYLASAGVLGPATLAVHCVHLDDAEVGVLAGAGAAVAHCPRSNARLRCGIAPVAALRKAGVRVGLGTDSLASNDSLDMFAEMRAALTADRARAAAHAASPTGESAAETLTSADVLRMATIEGARALNWADKVGSLDLGKRADLTVVGLPEGGCHADAGILTAEGMEAFLVSHTSGSDVQATLVDGRFVFERHAAPQRDLTELGAAFDEARRKLGLPPLRLTGDVI